MPTVLAWCSTQSDLQHLDEDEQNIAEALSTILSRWIDSGNYGELPELVSFEDSVVQVTFFHGYKWHESDIPYTDLLELAPEGITCIIRIPSSLGHERGQYEANYYVFCLGRRQDGAYYTEKYQFYAIGVDSIEILSGYSDMNPSVDSFNEFEFYFP